MVIIFTGLTLEFKSILVSTNPVGTYMEIRY